MCAGPGLRYSLMGPLRTADLGGLDVFFTISDYLFSELSAAQSSPEKLKKTYVEQNKLGAKTGAGFYDYDKEELQRLLARRDRILLEFIKKLEET
jgi:3-hydroxybutyryl-CoA dehydrogenase